MIVHCENCKAPYQVEEQQVGDDGIALECTSCSFQFRVVQKVFYLTEALAEDHGLDPVKTTPASEEKSEVQESQWDISQSEYNPKQGLTRNQVIRRTIHRPDIAKSRRPFFYSLTLIILGFLGWMVVFPDHFGQTTQKLRGDIELVAQGTTMNISSEAKAAYLKGRGVSVFDTEEKYLSAIQTYKDAIQVQPDYAAAYGALSEASVEIAEIMIGDKKEKEARKWLDECLKSGTRALTLDPENLEAHLAISSYERLHGNFVEAQKHLQKAILLDPQDVDVQVAYGRMFLSKDGLETTAKDYLKKALSIDERSIRANRYMAVTLDRLGKFKESKEYWQKVLDLSNEHSQAQFEIVRLSALTKGLDKMKKSPPPTLEKNTAEPTSGAPPEPKPE